MTLMGRVSENCLGGIVKFREREGRVVNTKTGGGFLFSARLLKNRATTTGKANATCVTRREPSNLAQLQFKVRNVDYLRATLSNQILSTSYITKH